MIDLITLTRLQDCIWPLCRKPDETNERVRNAQRELSEEGVMTPLSALSVDRRNAIAISPFRHYIPLRMVHKPSLVSLFRLGWSLVLVRPV